MHIGPTLCLSPHYGPVARSYLVGSSRSVPLFTATYYSLPVEGSNWGQRQGVISRGRFSVPPKPHDPHIKIFSFWDSRRVILFHGAWATKTGGQLCSFARDGARRHHPPGPGSPCGFSHPLLSKGWWGQRFRTSSPTGSMPSRLALVLGLCGFSYQIHPPKVGGAIAPALHRTGGSSSPPPPPGTWATAVCPASPCPTCCALQHSWCAPAQHACAQAALPQAGPGGAALHPAPMATAGGRSPQVF